MFCYQCEQTSQGQGCAVVGVCGKDENTATLQDLLIYAVKGISQYAHRARQFGASDAGIDAFTIEAIFATLTNVNFDEKSVAKLVHRAAKVRDEARVLYEAVLGVAGTVIEAVKSGALRRFFLIGGCDGARSGRNYYTELADNVPQDCIILTLACGKYRFNKHTFGTLGGLPRLLDMGQCNDAYSALKVAQALAGAFECGVNDLPLSLVLSWYEQKAVAILLTLLWLRVKNIRIGPTLPAFLTPAVLELLRQNYNLLPTTTVEADLAAMLG